MVQGGQRKSLDAFVDEYSEDVSKGMGIRVENTEGGGDSVPDESHEFENRREWLEEAEHQENTIWMTLAEGEFKGRSPGEDEELVFIQIPQWYMELDDNNVLSRTVNPVGGYDYFAIIDAEQSKESGAWAVTKLLKNGYWKSPSSKYNYAWPAKSVCTVYRRVGEPRPLDAEQVYQSDALPQGVDGFEAEEEDYDWRRALGKAYQRCEDERQNPLEEAREKAEQQLPERLYNRVDNGFYEYMSRAEADGREPDSQQLADVMYSLMEAFDPNRDE